MSVVSAAALVVAAGALSAPRGVAATAPALVPGWPPSGEEGAPPALGADGLLYAQAPGGLAVLNPDGTRRALIRSSRLGVPVRGRDGRVYAVRARGEQLVVVGRDLRLHALGGRIPFGKYSDLVGVSTAGRPALHYFDKNGLQKLEALGRGELIYRATPGYTAYVPVGIPSYPARLEALAPGDVARWSRPLPADPTALATAPDGDVRVALADGEVLAISPQGALRWRAPVDAVALGLAVAPDGTTYAASGTAGYGQRKGLLVALGPDGARRFGRTLPGRPVAAPLLARDGMLYLPLRGALVALAPSGGTRFTLRLPGQASRLAQGPDGSVAFAATDVAVPPGLRSLYLIPGHGEPRARVGSALRLSTRRFRSAGPVSLCHRRPRSRCRPAVPLGTTMSVRLPEAARVGIAVRRRGARRALIRSTIGDMPAGPFWLRFDGRSWPNRRLGGGPLRGLCDHPYCRPLRPGPYRIALTLRSGRVRILRADVVVERS